MPRGPGCTASPAPPPITIADPEHQEWALHWKQQAQQVRKRVLRYTTALGLGDPRPVPQSIDYVLWFAGTTPADDPTAEPEPYGVLSMREWGRDCKALAVFWREVRIPELRHRLTHPAGSGAARWWPLASFLGWPDSERANWIHCVTGESHGDPTTVGKAGELNIMQIHPCHAKAFRRVTGVSFWCQTTWDNVKFGLWLWKQAGWSPWSAMRGRV